MTGKLLAPFTAAHVDALNAFQRLGYVHPFTCPGHKGGGDRNLVATRAGWICCHCDYRQTWAHAGMLNPPEDPTAALRREAARASADHLRDALEALIQTASILHQNALGCATKHHGLDLSKQELPAWLRDTKATIEAAQVALSVRPTPGSEAAEADRYFDMAGEFGNRMQKALDRVAILTKGVRAAIDLLTERTHGNLARSPAHNARVKLERVLIDDKQQPVAPPKSLSDFTDAEIATEYGRRMQRALGGPRIGVGSIALCGDCPPVGHTHKTRCLECPRRVQL